MNPYSEEERCFYQHDTHLSIEYYINATDSKHPTYMSNIAAWYFLKFFITQHF